MGPIPIPRETTQRPVPQGPLRKDARSAARTSLPGNPLAPAAARRFARAALADWTSLGLLATCTFCQGSAAGAGGCLTGQHSTDLLADDTVVVLNELVTNAVIHAGTTVEVLCRLADATEPDDPSQPDGDPAALLIEVSDHHPTRAVRSGVQERSAAGAPEYGRGLQVVGSLAERWGITYRSGLKTVWARLPLDGREPAVPGGGAVPGAAQSEATGPALRRELRAAEILAPASRRTVRDDPAWVSRGALAFLAEASDLLAGQLDEDLVAALACQLLVPRLADWCAVWLDAEGGAAGAPPRLARVWHLDESRIDQLRAVLETAEPRLPEAARPGSSVRIGPAGGAVAGLVSQNGAERAARRTLLVGGPGGPDGPDDLDTEVAEDSEDPADPADPADAGYGAAFVYRLVANGRAIGTLMLGRLDGRARVPDEVSSLVEDFARRVALAIGAARRYTRQATISRVLQRGLLPSQVARIPGVASSLVYEPSDDGLAGGDFYDVFPCPPGGRWCFMLGDVQGSGPEAAVVTGLARPWLRLLAREGYRVGEVLDRLNRLLLDDATEAAEAASLMVASAAGPADGAQALPDGSQPRFLSLLYGELMPLPGPVGGVRCTLASAGHPLPLLLRPDGSVRPAAEPQLLLGVVENIAYESHTFDLQPGDTLLCVTDGVTERRSGQRLLDDCDGLARVLAGCVGLPAQGVAERIRRAVHDFDGTPPGDDLALLVFQAE